MSRHEETHLKSRASQKEQSESQSSPEASDLGIMREWRRPLGFHIVIALFCFLIAGLVGYSLYEGNRIADVHVPLMDAILELRLELTSGHLWFEEILVGDRHKNISVVWSSLDKADEFTQAMLEGGQFHLGPIVPITDPTTRTDIIKLKSSLKNFREITQRRWQNRNESGPGSNIDQEYDAVFEEIEQLAVVVEASTIALIKKDRRVFRVAQISLIGMCLILFVTAGFLFFQYEKHRYRSILTINKSRKKLELDILRREKVEKELATSKRAYQLLTELSPAGIFRSSADGNIEFANQAWCHFTGMTLSEAPGKNWLEIVGADDRNRVAEEWQLAVGEERYFSSEFQIQSEEGVIYTVLCRARRELDDGVVGYVGAIIDITELKIVEEELLHSSQNLSHHIQNTPLGVIEWDMGMKVVGWNRRAEKIFGYTKEEAMGKHCVGLIVDPDRADEVLPTWNQLLENSGGQRLTNDNTNKVGDRLICEWYNTPRVNPRGDACGVVSLVDDITIRRKATEELKQSEETYRSIFEAAANLITSVNSDGIIVDCNNRSFALLGYSREEMIGKPMTDIIHPGYHEKAYGHIKELIETGTSYGNEYKFIRKDGKEIDVSISSSSLKDKDGKFERSMCILTDISEQKRISETLKTVVEGTSPEIGTEFFRSLAMHLASALDVRYALIGEFYSAESNSVRTVAVWSGDSFGENIEYDLEGTPCEKVVGKSLCVYPANIQHTFPEDELLGVMDAESFVGVALFDSNGKALGIMAILDDKPLSPQKIKMAETLVTIFASWASAELERRTIENALKLSEAQFRGLVETSQDLIWTCDADGCFTYLNIAWERVLGYNLDEMLGHKFSDFQTPDIAERDKKEFGRHLAGGSVLGYETIHIAKSGQPVNLVFNAVPLFDNLQNIIGTQGTAHDISETKRLRELESRAQKLETAGQIAGQVAHDFNNLLAPFMAYPEFIREELPPNHPILGYIGDIELAAQQIAEINQQLLTLARRGHYDLEVVQLNGLIAQAIRHMEAAPDSLTVSTDFSDKLCNIKGGQAQLSRVMINLLLNAREAMHDVGVLNIKTENYYADEVSINFGRIPRGEYVKVTISDTGCGIPEEIRLKILDPFFTTKRTDKKRGSGLGLSVVAAVMEDHGAYLDLSSEVDRGTSFYIYFPITREAEKPDNQMEVTGGTERLLVVDDDQVQRDVATKILTHLGYTIEAVASGEQAVRLMSEQSYDLIILDMIMPPGIDGTETYRQILEINPQQRAIIFSGFAESDRVAEALQLGAGIFLKKPLSYTKFAQAIRSELDRKTETIVSA